MIRFPLIALKCIFFLDNCIVCGSAPRARGSELVAARLLRERLCDAAAPALPSQNSVTEKDNYSLHVLPYFCLIYLP